MKKSFIYAAQILLLYVGLAACDPSDPCDPGYYEDHGGCYLVNASKDASADDDSGTKLADAAAPSYEGFGTPCSSAADCSANAPACGAPMSPVCTVVNCLKLSAGVCPPTWTCLDVSTLSPDPTVTSVCIKL